MTRIIKWGLIAVAAVVVVVAGYLYYVHRQYYPSTDDAYVQATTINIAAQVGGRVASVPVSSHQSVTRGQLLFSIVSDQYQLRYREAEANLALARQQVSANEAAVTASNAAVSEASADLENAQRQYQRLKKLAARHMAPQSDLDDARAKLKSANAAVALAKARLQESRRQLGSAGPSNESIRKAQAAAKLASLDLQHTRITAPCSGTLAGVPLERGDIVSANASQFVLVCNHRFWVYANFKETELVRIRPGQFAKVEIDMYPNHTFHGVVESINPASGAAFSLLPPENATGNWVKVSQRVPVRLLIVDATPAFPMRVQTSSTVTINTGTDKKPLGLARGTELTNVEAEQMAHKQGLLVSNGN